MATSLFAAGTKTINVGQSATITVTADGTQPFTYQWRKNGVNISGATSRDYTIQLATVADAGDYTVVVSNPKGSAPSDIAKLGVDILPPSNVVTTFVVSITATTSATGTTFAVTTNPPGVK